MSAAVRRCTILQLCISFHRKSTVKSHITILNLLGFNLQQFTINFTVFNGTDTQRERQRDRERDAYAYLDVYFVYK